MEERCGGIAMQKKERVCAQHGVPTDHFADIGGLNERRHQPRPRYAEVE
jgi:hypothetical protein